MQDDKEVKKLLIEGTKYYSNGQYEESCNLFSELNELYNALNSKNDPYYLYLYGRSLYNLGLESADVFGGGGAAADGDNESGSESEDEKKSSGAGFFQFGGEVEEEEEEEEEDAEQPQEEGEEEEENEEEEEEEGTDFENAWSVLEISKSLYEQRLLDKTLSTETQSEIKIQLSEIYDILGLISLEMGNFPQGQEDFKKVLSLRESVYGVSDPLNKLIIEANYKISMAFEMDPLEYKKSEEYLQKVIALLKERKTCGIEDTDDESLLDDLQDKLSEIEKSNKEYEISEIEQVNKLKSLLDMAPSASSASSAPVNDLNSIVKRKKKSTEDDDDDGSNKKLKK